MIPRLNSAKHQILEEKKKDREGANLLEKFKCLEHIDTYIEEKIELFKKCTITISEKIILNYSPSRYFTVMHS